ncbi:MAG: SDR family oxidoreductase [Ferruginibacter sp.]
MKLLIFGATGGTGRLVIRQALDKSFNVTAFVRDPGKVNLSHPLLKIVKGDVLQQHSIDTAMEGHDAVICCLGAPATKAGLLRSEGTKNIISSMQKFGISRLICQTSLGYDDSEKVLNYTPFVFRKIIAPFLLKKTFEDHSRQESKIKESDLNWTIVRPGTMTNSPVTGKYKHGYNYNDSTWKVKISRADVAQFMLAQLNNTGYNKMAVGISY